MSDDPCNCEHQCAHGDRCIGGHANYPADHWYHCEICTPPTCEMFIVAGHPDSVIGIMRECGHAIGPMPLGRVSRSVRPHQLACRPVVAEGNAIASVLEWAADEMLAQDAAHGGDSAAMVDLTDHIRCFASQPDRGSAVTWPENVVRPRGVRI